MKKILPRYNGIYTIHLYSTINIAQMQHQHLNQKCYKNLDVDNTRCIQSKHESLYKPKVVFYTHEDNISKVHNLFTHYPINAC